MHIPFVRHKSQPAATPRNAAASMRLLPVAALAFAVVATLAACDDDKKEIISGSTNPETTPTMTTTDVSTIVSDSGVARYKITTPLWLMFEEAEEPTWRFPKGVHLEKFDQMLRQEATIDCDSATFYKDKQLWQLDGYVNIRNTLGEKFLTNQLFWNQRQQKIYSDSFIHIEREGKIIEGYGFESNETMTRYEVLRVAGIFPAEQFKSDSSRRAAALADTVKPDTLPQGPVSIVPRTQTIDDSRYKKKRILYQAPVDATPTEAMPIKGDRPLLKRRLDNKPKK